MATLHLHPLDNNVQGRLALVTGSSGGIGSASARALAAEGCDILLHYSSSKDKAETLAQQLRAQHPSQLFVPVAADLSSRESTRDLVPSALAIASIAAKHKAISILVANAGLGRRIRDPKDIGEDDWDEIMEVNARSQFVVVKACLPGMRAQSWGRVVLGALSSMGLNLSTVLAPEGVTVNTVLPAMIGYTGMIPAPKSMTWTEGANLEAIKETDLGLGVAAGIPVRRLGHPDEVANVVTMFAKTGYMTGQEIVLSGGLK
uniref:3-oxoacyl-[acyl-carrier-protein] reductase n=1 Tax=Bionectria ochroleuca TaxID=29856 RepID=A0A0B7K3T3_BIOOC